MRALRRMILILIPHTLIGFKYTTWAWRVVNKHIRTLSFCFKWFIYSFIRLKITTNVWCFRLRWMKYPERFFHIICLIEMSVFCLKIKTIQLDFSIRDFFQTKETLLIVIFNENVVHLGNQIIHVFNYCSMMNFLLNLVIFLFTNYEPFYISL